MLRYRYRGVSGKSRTLQRPDSLVDQMEGVLEALLDSRKEEALEALLELLPKLQPENVDFLVRDYLPDLVEYWRLKTGLRVVPEEEGELRRNILEKIGYDREKGERKGFTVEVLDAVGRVIAKAASKPKGVDKWNERLQKALVEERNA